MFAKFKFFLTAPRLGPDMPLTHLLLHSKRLARRLCKRQFAHFGAGSEFRAGAYAVNTHRIQIGQHVIIRPGTMLFASQNSEISPQIHIEDYALIGSGVHIYVSNHHFNDPTMEIYFQGHDDVKPVTVSRGCWIGANVIILPGVTIGRNAVVGAGSVVTRSVPDFAVVAGNPAKIIRSQSKDSSNSNIS